MRPLPDQQVAIEKLSKIEARLCGDSMGVGKTVTGIGLDLENRKTDPRIEDLPTLIISEKIGLDVWDYHLKAMGIPPQEILLIDPSDRKPFELALDHESRYQAKKTKVPPNYVYYVVHWDAINRLPALTKMRTPSSKFPQIQFAHVIADEVHLAKNRKALRTLALKRIHAIYKTGLSGTPADDKPWDIWSILHWLYPKKFRSFWRFWDDYIQWVAVSDIDDWNDWAESGGDYDSWLKRPDIEMGHGYRIPVGVKNLNKLHRLMQPFYIRRTLDEVDPNMPPKVHVHPPIVVKMTARQRREYNRMRDKALAEIGDGFTLLAKANIAVLIRLQQMALATLVPVWEVKDSDWVENEDDIEWDHPRIVLAKPSPKLDAVMDLITTHEEEPFVVFTQFRGMADLVEEECQRLKIPVVKIHGGIPDKDERTRLVKEFQDGKARVFVGTIAAAGKTITLTKAHIAIFIDRSWNPSKNEQAEDRLWRRTQKNAVRIYHIEAEDSVDQIRLVRISQKADWTRALMNPKEYK
jgi:SNF2 family DNA or RNA helicase